MHITSNPTFYLLAILIILVPTLSGCDSGFGGQDTDWTPGDSLAVVGPVNASGDQYDGYAPGTAYFYVQPHNDRWTYEWSVSLDVPAETGGGGESFEIQIDTSGTYTVTVVTREEGEPVDGSASAEITLPTVATQLGRLSRFATLTTTLSLVDAALPDMLGADTTDAGAAVELTVLAPPNRAFTAAFDADEDGDLESAEVPAPNVLLDLLQFHIIPEKVTAGDLTSGASYETLEGDEVTFQKVSDEVSVLVDGTSVATVTETDIPTSNGVIHAVDAVLLPLSASVDFMDQAAVDSVSVASVYLPEGGFVAIHAQNDGGGVGEVIGVSEKLEAGLHSNVEIALFAGVPGADFEQDALQADQTLIAMPHVDNPADGEYTFVLTPGTDGPYTEDGGAVVDDAAITVEE